MKDWKQAVVSPQDTIRDAIRTIDAGGIQTALVIDRDNLLCGTVTDGDIRRAILKELPLDTPVEAIMKVNPTIARHGDTKESILVTMKLTGHRHIPIVDEKHHVVEVAFMEDLIQTEALENWVILMAGGLGTRLRPLTENCPKPLLQIGNKPILQTILENCRDHGLKKFYISINYKAEMVKEHFGDGSRWGVTIKYIEEQKRMGTAGALSLLDEKPDSPVLVMNGDLLTKVNFQNLLDFHKEHSAQATMCVREYHFQIPYGVVEINGQRITSIIEKPSQRFLVNAGIYVLQPETLGLIPTDTFFDMPDLFKWLIERGLTAAAFPIREYWVDIGQMPDLEQARGDYKEIFV